MLLYAMAPIFPTLCSQYLFRLAFGRKLDLRHPKTLDEKLMWLKLNAYRDNPLITECADKYRVREYVRECGCGELLTNLYGVWDDPDDIPWEDLPSSFALKCNHASGYNILCPDKSKMDIPSTKKQLRKWMRRDYWRFLSEIQYKGIRKCIICEELLASGNVTDYKIYCFHGEPLYILACVGRKTGSTSFYFFDTDWNLARITHDGKAAPEGFTLPRPIGLDKMLRYSRELSAPFPFVRVDLYDVNGHIYFGELTFIPAAALDTRRLPETDLYFGSILNLENVQIEKE